MTAFVMWSHRRRWLVVLALATGCAACTSPVIRTPEPPPTAATVAPASGPEGAKDERTFPSTAAPSKGAQELERAVKSYEEGEYRNAAKQFQAALDFGLDAKADQANAHKYLAFIACVSGREKACRDEFRKALEADPAFELAPAEIGHPLWGPVFRSVKADAAVKVKAK
jgi:tetratricopeptide (TPR) repeat protein